MDCAVVCLLIRVFIVYKEITCVVLYVNNNSTN